MSRMILIPALLVSGLALAADPAPTQTPTSPTTTTPGKTTTPTADTPATGAPMAKAVFKDVDKNKDGSIDKVELANIQDLLSSFNAYDTDKNGKLSEAEYKVWLDKPSSPAGQAVFEDLDKNKDSALDKAELAAMADLIRDFNTIDSDKNGKLNKSEYSAWVSKQNQM